MGKEQDSGGIHGLGVIAVNILENAICYHLPLSEITIFITISINVDQIVSGIWSQEEKHQPEPKHWIKIAGGKSDLSGVLKKGGLM